MRFVSPPPTSLNVLALHASSSSRFYFFCVCEFSKTKIMQQQQRWGEPQVFETKWIPPTSPPPFPVPENILHCLHCCARAALVINWAGGEDHVSSALWIQIRFVVFMMR